MTEEILKQLQNECNILTEEKNEKERYLANVGT